MSNSTTTTQRDGLKPGWLARVKELASDNRDPERVKISQRDLSSLVRNLAMMVRGGLSLPRALETLAKERGLKRYAWVFQTIRRRIEIGDSFSRALSLFPRTFTPLIVQQVKVGERTGDMAGTLERIAGQLTDRGSYRRQLLKRLSYPALVATCGAGLVVFMMTVVVPQFESVYAGSDAQLPWVTTFVSATSRAVFRFGWIGILLAIAAVASVIAIRRHPVASIRFDAALLKIPVVGRWLRDYAVLQFMDAVGTMLHSGFKPLDAIQSSIPNVGNRAVRESIVAIKNSLVRGGRLSDELGRSDDLFPPTVTQLITVGEATSDLSHATSNIREHLQQSIKDRVEGTLALVEPALTVLLAIMIGFIVLAVYLPMFGMIDAME